MNGFSGYACRLNVARIFRRSLKLKIQVMITENLQSQLISRKTQEVFIYVDDILPFTEVPSCDGNSEEATGRRIAAPDLFALFTADIIKEKVVFTR